jgi:hypothetical protein
MRKYNQLSGMQGFVCIYVYKCKTEYKSKREHISIRISITVHADVCVYTVPVCVLNA